MPVPGEAPGARARQASKVEPPRRVPKVRCSPLSLLVLPLRCRSDGWDSPQHGACARARAGVCVCAREWAVALCPSARSATGPTARQAGWGLVATEGSGSGKRGNKPESWRGDPALPPQMPKAEEAGQAVPLQPKARGLRRLSTCVIRSRASTPGRSAASRAVDVTRGLQAGRRGRLRSLLLLR